MRLDLLSKRFTIFNLILKSFSIVSVIKTKKHCIMLLYNALYVIQSDPTRNRTWI